MTEITIPPSVTKIGFIAFFGCSSRVTLSIPSSITNIGAFAFNECSLKAPNSELTKMEPFANIDNYDISDLIKKVDYCSSYRVCSRRI